MISVEETIKQSIIEKAKVRLAYKSNINKSNADFNAILSDFFDNAVGIIEQWRKLKDETEIESRKWDNEIVGYIVDSYNAMNEEILATSSSNGVTRGYKISPENSLKSKIPQKMF